MTRLGLIVAIVGLSLLASDVRAQAPGSAPLPPARPAPGSKLRITPPNQNNAQVPPSLNDPTVPSPELRGLITPERTEANGTTAPAFSVPSIRLRARIVSPKKPAMALLDVDGVLVRVREGDRVPRRGGAPLKVTKLTSKEVELEMADREQVIIVN